MFTSFKLTNNGKAMHIKSVFGDSIKFTKVAFGSGAKPDDFAQMNELNNVVVSVPFVSYDDTTNQNILNLKWELDTSEISNSFTWSEYGLYAEDKDGNEFLYAYAYDDTPITIDKIEQGVVSLYVGYVTVSITDTDNITVELGEYDTVTVNQFKAHTENANNPHNVTAEQVGLGKVENVSPSDAVPKFTEANRFENVSSGDKTSTLWGKVQKAIFSLLNHMSDRNNPHNVTTVQIGAAKTSHNHSANDITSGVLSVERGGTGTTSLLELTQSLISSIFNTKGIANTNLDSILSPGTYFVFNGCSNCPVTYNGILFVFEIDKGSFYQCYLPNYGGRYYMRDKANNNDWSNWQ